MTESVQVAFLDEGEVQQPQISILNDNDIKEGTNTTGLVTKCSIPDCNKYSIKICQICLVEICPQHCRAFEEEQNNMNKRMYGCIDCMQERRAIRKNKIVQLEPLESMEKKTNIKLPKKSYESARIQANIARKYGLNTPRDRMRQKRVAAFICFIIFLLILAGVISMFNPNS